MPNLCNFPGLPQIGFWSILLWSAEADLSAKSEID
jgi:hypothetical protein